MDSDALLENPMTRMASARRPLLGVTVLLVEDSRFCSEVVRLMCQRAGARLRRADSLQSARRHLATYRPSVVLVDLGLPDGSGLELIKEIAGQSGAQPVLLATSGEDASLCEDAAIAAGAQKFLAKPFKDATTFQNVVLGCFPDARKVEFGNVVALTYEVKPDSLALGEDLDHIRDLINEALADGDTGALTYCAQFLRSVAAFSEDPDLAQTAENLTARLLQGHAGRALAGQTVDMIDARLRAVPVA